MEFAALVRSRYSVRAYRPDPVEDGKLAQVLEAARLAPTAANRQPFRLIVVRTAGRPTELQRVYARKWLTEAPLLVCACGVPSEAWVRKDGTSYLYVDVAIAMDHLVLAAADLGLGTCWVAAFDVAAAREVFGLPEDVIPIALTPLGYPADVPKPKERKPLSELVRYEHW
jgi:nitroreductase